MRAGGIFNAPNALAIHDGIGVITAADLAADAGLPAGYQGETLVGAQPGVATLQQLYATVLDRSGYNPIAVTGVSGPELCGAIAWAGEHSTAMTAAENKSIDLDVLGAVIMGCSAFTMPTKKGSTTPDLPKKTNPREQYALPWGVSSSATASAQKNLNIELTGHDYLPISVSGVLDAPTCGALRFAEQHWGNSWEYDFGLNCKDFVEPQPKAVPPAACPSGFEYRDGDCKAVASITGAGAKQGNMLMFGLLGLGAVAAVVYVVSQKKRGRSRR